MLVIFRARQKKSLILQKSSTTRNSNFKSKMSDKKAENLGILSPHYSMTYLI